MLKIKFAIIYFGLLIFSSALLISCSEDNNNNVITPVPVDSSDFRFPFTNGFSWNYTITTSASDIQPDSILYYFEGYYPIIMNGTASIMYDTVINSVVTKCFLDEFTLNGITRSNRFYYINNDTALILYASRRQSPAAGILPFRKIKNEMEIPDVDNKNNVYNNVLEIQSDSLYSTLKYPIVTGTEWSHANGGVSVVRKYLGFENVIVPAGTVSCVKKSTVYSVSLSGINYDYYSKSGLMKSYTFFNDIVVTNIANPDGIGTYDLTGETIVTSFIIPSD